MQSQMLLLNLGLPIACAIGGYQLAKKKHRNSVAWALICFFTDLLGILILACSGSLYYDEELDYSETDTFGYTMFVVACLWFIISFWYSYNATKAYHENLLWNLGMSLLQ